MSIRLKQHPNEVWLLALKGEGEDSSLLLRELSSYIRRVLGSTLSSRTLPEDDLIELVQEAMAQLLGSLHTFRGDSAFPTWAAAVATRVAFTELRRRAARQANHAEFQQAQSDALESCVQHDVREQEGLRQQLLKKLHAAIDTELTDRQRIATLALLRGVPTIEIAEQLDSNQNAVYKLVHDARLRLREALQRRGVTVDQLDEMATGGGVR